MSSKEQGKKNPGPSNRGKPPNRGKHHQSASGSQAEKKGDGKQSGGSSKASNQPGKKRNNETNRQKQQSTVPNSGPQQNMLSLQQNVGSLLSGIFSGNSIRHSGPQNQLSSASNIQISLNLQTSNFASNLSFQSNPSPIRQHLPTQNKQNNRGAFSQTTPQNPNFNFQHNNPSPVRAAAPAQVKLNARKDGAKANPPSKDSSTPTQIRIFSGNQKSNAQRGNNSNYRIPVNSRGNQFHRPNFVNPSAQKLSRPFQDHQNRFPVPRQPAINKQYFPPPRTNTPISGTNFFGTNSTAKEGNFNYPTNFVARPLLETPPAMYITPVRPPVYKFKKAKAKSGSQANLAQEKANLSQEKAKKANSAGPIKHAARRQRQRKPNVWKKKSSIAQPTPLFSFQKTPVRSEENTALPDSEEEGSTSMSRSSDESIWTTNVSNDEVDDSLSDDSETVSEISMSSSIKGSEASFDVNSVSSSNVPKRQGYMSVFWDIENCPVPHENSVVDFVKRVRTMFLEGRTEANFWVVCDVKKLKDIISVELGLADITLIHVDGTSKNAADVKITNLLQEFRDKYREGNSAIVLISGDSDFATTLNNMNYKYHVHINLICKKNSKHSLTEAAHKFVYYEDFVKDLPSRKKEELIQYLIIVSNFPQQKKVKAIRKKLNERLKGVNCRVSSLDEKSIEIISADESARARALSLLHNYTIEGIVLQTKCLERENTTSLETPSKKKKSKSKSNTNLPENQENEQKDDELNNKGATLCVIVSQNAADIPYWKKEFENLWNMSDFVLQWEGGIYEGYFLAIFKSLSKAQKARKVLEKAQMNNPSSPKFLKLIKQDNILSLSIKSDTIEDVNRRKIDDHIRIIESKKESSIVKHKKAMADLKTLSKNVAGATDSLGSKSNELNEQLITFMNFTQNTKEKVNKIDLSSEVIDKTLSEILRDYSRECNCISNALPIYAKKNSILKKIKKHQVVVIRAETGSGKSTQLAQYIWREQNFQQKGLIICTQPRKIAAITLAKHVSSQIGCSLGDIVGYQVGMAVKKSPSTSILYVTDFAMLKMIISNDAKDVSVIIVDEAHERTLYTDLLLGMIKSCLQTRPDLKLIITSATIEISVFSNYFNLSEDAILEVSGRSFPIEDIWLDQDVLQGWDYFNKTINTVCTIISDGPGDVLVFLTTPFETEKAVKVLSEKLDKKTAQKVKILQLHGKLDVQEQQKIFDHTPTGMRKVVFATNCAETSVTVPGVKYVVDCGMVKESHYDVVRNMSVMTVNFVSQSSAEQRRGRAGRTQIGKCYRLYSKSNYNNMVKSSEPEILRVNLGQALLKLMKIGVTDPLQFDFVQSPPSDSLNHAMNQLIELNAVNLFDLSLTNLGEFMSCLPLEPRLSHLVFAGIDLHIGFEAVVLASLITVSRNIFFRSADNKSEADVKKMRFCQSESDFLTFFEVYKEWAGVPKQSKSKWCTMNCINARSLRTAQDLVNELLHVLENEVNLKVCAKFSEEFVQDDLLKVVFRSFFQNLCVFSGYHRFGYKSNNISGNLLIHPSSSLYTFGRWRPQFLVYDTILKTDQTYLINVSPVSKDVIMECITTYGLNINVDALESLQLTTFAIAPIGKMILLHNFIGKGGISIKAIESKLRQSTGTDYLAVEVDVQKGELKVMGPQSKYEEIEAIVCPVIEKAREKLALEEKEVFIYPELCAIISAGINVKDVVVPGEFKDLKVILNTEMDISVVVEKLQTCGQVISVREWKNYFKITFLSPAHAKMAMEKFKNDSSFTLYKISKNYYVDDRANQYKIFVSFLRRGCTGMAYITIDPLIGTDATLIYNSLRYKEISYHNVRLTCSTSKKSGDLRIAGLPPDTDRNELIKLINSNIQDSGKVTKCLVVRKNAYESSKLEVDEIKDKLLEMFGQFTSKEKLSIDLKKPTSKDFKWTAYVFFKNSCDGEAAVSVLKTRTNVNSWQNFEMKPTLQTFLYCKLKVFSAIKEQVEEALKFFKDNTVAGNTFNITVIPKGENDCQIQITSNNVADISDARRSILNCLLGDTIECSGPLLKLFTTIGQERIKKISEGLSNCYIELNNQKKVLTIFGNDTACNTVKLEINKFLDKLEQELFEDIPLMPETGKPGVLRELLRKYGHNLEELKRVCGFNNIEINSRKHILKIMGSTSSVSKCQGIINELKAQLEGVSYAEDEETCPVCSAKVSEEFHRLEYCGHAYCKECILHLLQSSDDFPLTCISCGDPVVMADVYWAMKEVKSFEVELFKKSLTAFVGMREDVGFCPSPDCPMIFRVSAEGSVFECPSCNNSICTQCQEIYHYGMSCSLYQCSKEDSDYSLKVWLSAEPSQRKQCPTCSSPIEKNGGCNHMTCWKCKSHMCWLCLQVFPDDSKVYDHQPFCLKGNLVDCF